MREFFYAFERYKLRVMGGILGCDWRWYFGSKQLAEVRYMYSIVRTIMQSARFPNASEPLLQVQLRPDIQGWVLTQISTKNTQIQLDALTHWYFENHEDPLWDP